ncbi:uncharacterized protein [Anabrus simplex]|uniref:uncharacterized protein n=1 Tax=Anabrus simplex TaxID=316456 RepID=UPI0034DD2C49
MVYFNDIIGNVIDLHPPFKCTVTFSEQGVAQRALLMSERLVVDGRKAIPGMQIQDYLQIGSCVRFCCHEFDTAKDGMYDWFITNAWRLHKEDHITHISDGFLGLYNCVGKMVNLAKRQGVLVYTDHKGKEHNVLFLGSKLSMFGKRLSSKHSLQETITEEDQLLFDAVPCSPSENDFQCSWFATVVWKGKKPVMDYESSGVSSDVSLVTQYKQVAANPKSFFVRGTGMVMSIIDDEFGLALLAIKNNRWESVLFHRSTVMLFKSSLPSDTPLKEVFNKDDRVCIIAAAAPKMFLAQWVATQVALDIGPNVDLDTL